MKKLFQMINRIVNILETIESFMQTIAISNTYPPLEQALKKESYSCRELAELSVVYGAEQYAQFTIRDACNQGRIPEASKRVNRQWAIPRGAALRVLRDGLPPKKTARNRRLIA